MSTDYSRNPSELQEDKYDQDDLVDEGYESAIEDDRLGEYILQERKDELLDAADFIEEELEGENMETEEVAEKYYVERVEQGETDLSVPSEISHVSFSTDVDQKDLVFGSLDNMNYSGRMLAVAGINSE